MEEFSAEFIWSFVGITVVTGIWLFLRWYQKNDDYWKKRGVKHVPRENILKALWVIRKTPIHELLLVAYKNFGRVFGSFEFRMPTLNISDPDLLRDILVKDFHAFHYRRDLNFKDKIFEKMVSILKGEDWKRVRTIITPAFTSKKMRKMSKLINDCSEIVIQNIRKQVREGKPSDCKGIFGAFSMDVIALAAFATKIDSHSDPNNPFVKHAKMLFGEVSIFRMMLFLLLPTWVIVKSRLIFFDAIDFFKEIVLDVIKRREQSGKKFDDILQLLMDAQSETENLKQPSKTENEDEIDQYGSVSNDHLSSNLKYKKLSAEELIAQCVLFFMVGYETTGSTMAFIAYALATNPECQEKLLQEVDEAFEKHGTLDYDAVRDMKYLDCVVSETLRMYPFLVRSERTACEDYKLGDTGIIIEKGTVVGFLIHAMHHDPELFEDPEKFLPERFMPENLKHHPYAYLPFGAGPRNCLGMRFALLEIKICICNVLRQFRFLKTEEPIKYKLGQAFLGVNQLFLKLEERSKN